MQENWFMLIMGKIPPAMKQLSRWATNTDLACLNCWKPMPRPATTEAQVPRACAAQQEPLQGKPTRGKEGVAPAPRN